MHNHELLHFFLLQVSSRIKHIFYIIRHYFILIIQLNLYLVQLVIQALNVTKQGITVRVQSLLELINTVSVHIYEISITIMEVCEVIFSVCVINPQIRLNNIDRVGFRLVYDRFLVLTLSVYKVMLRLPKIQARNLLFIEV